MTQQLHGHQRMKRLQQINDAGTVTAKSEGTTTITAKIGKFEATCEVTVYL